MATNQIVLTPLASWAESRFSGIFAAKDTKTFDEAFDNFVAGKPTSIVVNDKHVTREQFKQQLFEDRTPLLLGGAPDVKFAGAVGVPGGAGTAVCLLYENSPCNGSHLHTGWRSWGVFDSPVLRRA